MHENGARRHRGALAPRVHQAQAMSSGALRDPILAAPPLVMALPARARVASFAEGCRAAVLDFVNCVSVQADKQLLADWLRGPYRRHVVAIARAYTTRVEATTVMAGALEKLLVQTRQQLIVTLERARSPEDGVGFAFTALASNYVYRCQDVTGAQGWVPVAHPRMRLFDRVTSLIAADYLLNGDVYEEQLFTCAACGLVAFDAAAKERGVCCEHTRSDIRELVLPPPVAEAS
jgi:hypothetical protein